MLDAAHVQRKKHGIVCDLKRAIRSKSGSPFKSEKRAKESTETVRTLIIGLSSRGLANGLFTGLDRSPSVTTSLHDLTAHFTSSRSRFVIRICSG